MPHSSPCLSAVAPGASLMEPSIDMAQQIHRHLMIQLWPKVAQAKPSPHLHDSRHCLVREFHLIVHHKETVLKQKKLDVQWWSLHSN